MPNMSQRYIAALAELSQFQCVVGDTSNLTHALTGVQVAPEAARDSAEDVSLLKLTFPGGHSIDVIASLYLELQLAEDAAHNLHAVSGGSGEIHKRAVQKWEELRLAHKLQ